MSVSVSLSSHVTHPPRHPHCIFTSPTIIYSSLPSGIKVTHHQVAGVGQKKKLPSNLFFCFTTSPFSIGDTRPVSLPQHPSSLFTEVIFLLPSRKFRSHRIRCTSFQGSVHFPDEPHTRLMHQGPFLALAGATKTFPIGMFNHQNGGGAARGKWGSDRLDRCHRPPLCLKRKKQGALTPVACI